MRALVTQHTHTQRTHPPTKHIHTISPREKLNRPQTRRRRDNTEECLDKLRQLRENLGAAAAVAEQVVRRERRKRDIAHTEVELLRIRLRQAHDAKGGDAAPIALQGMVELKVRWWWWGGGGVCGGRGPCSAGVEARGEGARGGERESVCEIQPKPTTHQQQNTHKKNAHTTSRRGSSATARPTSGGRATRCWPTA